MPNTKEQLINILNNHRICSPEYKDWREYLADSQQKILKITANTSLLDQTDIKFSLTSAALGSKIFNIAPRKLLPMIGTLDLKNILVDITITKEELRIQESCAAKNKRIEKKTVIEKRNLNAGNLQEFLGKLPFDISNIDLQANRYKLLAALRDMKRYKPYEFIDVVSNLRFKDVLPKMAATGSLEQFEKILNSGMDIDQGTLDQSLQNAISCPTSEAVCTKVELLLQNGADPNRSYLSQNKKFTVLVEQSMICFALNSKGDPVKLTELLLKYGADPNKPCYKRTDSSNNHISCDLYQKNIALTPLWFALKSKACPAELTKLLVNNGVDLNAVCFSGETIVDGKVRHKTAVTPLYAAAKVESNAVLKLLLNAGAAMDLTDNMRFHFLVFSRDLAAEAVQTLFPPAYWSLKYAQNRSAIQDSFDSLWKGCKVAMSYFRKHRDTSDKKFIERSPVSDPDDVFKFNPSLPVFALVSYSGWQEFDKKDNSQRSCPSPSEEPVSVDDRFSDLMGCREGAPPLLGVDGGGKVIEEFNHWTPGAQGFLPKE